MKAYFGVHPTGQKTQPFKIIEKKIFRSQLRKHDIMLLKLPSTFLSYLKASSITPVKLPDCANPPKM